MIIYFDMDGVLADYDRGVDVAASEATSAHAAAFDSLPEKYRAMSDSAFKKALASDPALASYKEIRKATNVARNEATLQPGFFRNLELMPGAQEMVRHAKELFSNVGILSSPINIPSMPEVKEQCIREKTEWLNEHFAGVFTGEFIFDSEKQKYASPETVLIDDREDNIRKFGKMGGRTVLFLNAPQVMVDLDKISRNLPEMMLRKYIRMILENINLFCK